MRENGLRNRMAAGDYRRVCQRYNGIAFSLPPTPLESNWLFCFERNASTKDDDVGRIVGSGNSRELERSRCTRTIRRIRATVRPRDVDARPRTAHDRIRNSERRPGL